MKVIGKILKILGILLLALVLLIAAADVAWIYVPQIKAAKLAQAHAGDDYIKYNNIRDGFMAENVAWISAREETIPYFV